MKYRCPYCGEKGFSFIEKIDFLPRFLPEYFQGVRCAQCRERSVYHSRLGGRIGHVVIQAAIMVALTGFYLWAARLPEEILNGYYVLVPLLVATVLLYGFKGLFCYLDKPRYADRISAPTFRFTVDASLRLWPRVRVGEVYLLRFPKRGMHEDSPHVIAMVQRVERRADERVVTVRVVKEFLMKAPLQEEPVRLITNKNVALEGVVSQTYRLAESDESQ